MKMTKTAQFENETLMFSVIFFVKSNPPIINKKVSFEK